MSTDAPGPQPGETGPLAEQTDERSERADWRSSVVGAVGVTLLIGLWLIASIAVLEYERPSLAVIWGAVIVVLSLLRLLGPLRSRTLALALAAAGLLTVLTAVIGDESSGETMNLALMGGATTVLALISMAADAEAGRASRP
jgi:hypothetical protein